MSWGRHEGERESRPRRKKNPGSIRRESPGASQIEVPKESATKGRRGNLSKKVTADRGERPERGTPAKRFDLGLVFGKAKRAHKNPPKEQGMTKERGTKNLDKSCKKKKSTQATK